MRILTGALFTFNVLSQPSPIHNRQQRKTALPRGDGRPKFMQCSDQLSHMVNAFRVIRSYRCIRASINVGERGSVTKVVAHRSPLSPTKVCNDFCHRPSEDCQGVCPRFLSLRIYIQDQGSRRQLVFRCSISRCLAAH